MISPVITDWLDDLTDALKPAGNATVHNLEETRNCLGEALISGISPQEMNASPFFSPPMGMSARPAMQSLLQGSQPAQPPGLRSTTDIDLLVRTSREW